MVNKRERLIRNKAATVANQESILVHQSDISHLETLREKCGLNMGDVDDLLDEPNNWYSNNKRRGGTHEFSRPNYMRIRDSLEIEYLRDQVGFSMNEVSRGINKSRGWYEEHLQNGFKIAQYNKVVVFLVTAAVLQNKYDVLDDAVIKDFIELNIVNKDIIDDLRDSIDIEYGH